jgi:regulator of replication initiation timing
LEDKVIQLTNKFKLKEQKIVDSAKDLMKDVKRLMNDKKSLQISHEKLAKDNAALVEENTHLREQLGIPPKMTNDIHHDDLPSTTNIQTMQRKVSLKAGQETHSPKRGVISLPTG